MADRRPSRGAGTGAHSDHDRFAVVALAAGDLDGRELAEAKAQLEGCAECRALAAELGSIAAAVSTLPPPSRPRDFRLTPETAARLRTGGSGWRRLVDFLARPQLRLASPVGGGLVALGLAGLLFASLPIGPLPTSQPPGEHLTDVGSAATAAPSHSRAAITTAAPTAAATSGPAVEATPDDRAFATGSPFSDIVEPLVSEPPTLAPTPAATLAPTPRATPDTTFSSELALGGPVSTDGNRSEAYDPGQSALAVTDTRAAADLRFQLAAGSIVLVGLGLALLAGRQLAIRRRG